MCEYGLEANEETDCRFKTRSGQGREPAFVYVVVSCVGRGLRLILRPGSFFWKDCFKSNSKSAQVWVPRLWQLKQESARSEDVRSYFDSSFLRKNITFKSIGRGDWGQLKQFLHISL